MSKPTEVTQSKYARQDVQGGYLYGKNEIDYFSQTQEIDVISNLMLGDFNKKGAYVIDKGIIEQLVKMPKIYQYSFGSTTFCQSAFEVDKYGKIDFAIKMRNNTQNKTITSTLQLLETIDRANGYYQNTNSAVIAVYTAPESNLYVVEMLKYFNVSSKLDSGLAFKERKDKDTDLIVARKQYEEMLKNGMMDKVEECNKSLFERRLKLLEKYAVGKLILSAFYKESDKINGWFVKEGMPGYFRSLNQILDGIIEAHSAQVLQDVMFKTLWDKENMRFGHHVKEALGLQQNKLLQASKDPNTAVQKQQSDFAKKSDAEPVRAQVNQNQGVWAQTNSASTPSRDRVDSQTDALADATQPQAKGEAKVTQSTILEKLRKTNQRSKDSINLTTIQESKNSSISQNKQVEKAEESAMEM